MAKTIYAFKAGQSNVYGLTYDRTGANLPAHKNGAWTGFKSWAKDEKPRMGLSEEVLAKLEKDGYAITPGLKVVMVSTAVKLPQAPKKK